MSRASPAMTRRQKGKALSLYATIKSVSHKYSRHLPWYLLPSPISPLTLRDSVSPLQPRGVGWGFTVHGHFLPEAAVDVHSAEESHRLWQVVQPQLVGEHAPGKEDKAGGVYSGAPTLHPIPPGWVGTLPNTRDLPLTW